MRKYDYSQRIVSESTSSPDLVLLPPCITAQLPVPSRSNRDLKIRRPRRQREHQKAIGLITKTTILHVHHAFLYNSLPSLHDYDVKML